MDNTILYATVLGWPGGTLDITTLNSNRINLSTLASAQLLGSTAGSYLNLTRPVQDGSALHVAASSLRRESGNDDADIYGSLPT